jgi:hypothetical protein
LSCGSSTNWTRKAFSLPRWVEDFIANSLSIRNRRALESGVL